MSTSNILTWVEALESGKYTQVKEALKDAEGYCCLGVACDLFSEFDWEKDLDEEVYTMCGERDYLPDNVINALDIPGRGEQVGITKEELLSAYPFLNPSDKHCVERCIKAEELHIGSLLSLAYLNDN